jgi:hypothetical protein
VSDEEKLAQRIKLIEASLSIGITLWMIWFQLIPAHRRQLWRMTVLATVSGWTGTAARRAAAGSMRAELAGAGQRYELPYALSLARDRLARAYDSARGITP